MNYVKVDKHQLVGVLRDNREKHNAIFLEAQKGYRLQVISELDAMLSEARTGKKIRRLVTLPEPVDQTGDYDRAIKMLEMSVEDTVQLSEHEFQCYVLDDWNWKQNFTLTNSAYLVSNQ